MIKQLKQLFSCYKPSGFIYYFCLVLWSTFCIFKNYQDVIISVVKSKVLFSFTHMFTIFSFNSFLWLKRFRLDHFPFAWSTPLRIFFASYLIWGWWLFPFSILMILFHCILPTAAVGTLAASLIILLLKQLVCCVWLFQDFSLCLCFTLMAMWLDTVSFYLPCLECIGFLESIWVIFNFSWHCYSYF